MPTSFSISSSDRRSAQLKSIRSRFLTRTTMIVGVVLAAAAIGAWTPTQAGQDPYDRAKAMVVWAWTETGPCTSVRKCTAGSGVARGNGQVIPINRLVTSGRDMVVWAIAAQRLGYPDLAVSILSFAWRPHSRGEAKWVLDNPREVLRALDTEIDLYEQTPCEWARGYGQSKGWPIPPLCRGR